MQTDALQALGALRHTAGSQRLAWAAFALAAALGLAPSPALAAEPQRPDFTGVWTMYLEPGQSILSAFRGPPAVLPLTPEGKQRQAEYQKLLGPENANAAAYCVDYGMPMMMELAGAYPLEFIQKPDQLTIIYEVEGELRRIYLGGREVPRDRRLATRQGYSTGHWDKDVLVVETTDLQDGEDQLHPHSEQARISERFALARGPKGQKLIDYQMVLTDPVYYTEPVRASRKWEQVPNGFIMTYRCPDEFWQELRDARREQLKAGKPVNARMSDVYKTRELKE
jgi:hypothetical protein